MTTRTLILLTLFVGGLTFGVVAGRLSMPDARASINAPARSTAIFETPSEAVAPDAAMVSPIVEAADPEPVREITATDFVVTRVIDGDTFRVEYDGDLTSVRIRDIDAPERGDPRAVAATDELRRLVDGQAVRLEFGPGRKRDGFGRLLCRVYLGDLDIGQHLLDAELVEVYQPGPRRKKTP